jgi:integration host factor subunit alpha
MKETITKLKIVEELHKSIGLSKNECSTFLEEFINKLQITLKENKDLKIANFGSFIIKHKSARIGRNPRTKEEVMISARKVLKFVPSKLLINKINKK